METQRIEQIIGLIRQYSTPERPLYLVGGAVRDRLINRPNHDLDFALPGPTRQTARRIADDLGGAFYVMDEERDTTRVVLEESAGAGQPGERLFLDFASLRAATIEADLRRRDFTVNALAYDIAAPNRLVDPTGGLADLRAGVIRACSETSLSDDPARVLRGVRQAVKFRFRIEPRTLQLMRAAAPLLERVSPERRRDELFHMLEGSRVALSIRILDEIGALERVLPELEGLKGVEQSAPHTSNVWEHTLSLLAHLEALFTALVGEYHEDSAADVMTGLAVLRLGRFREALERHFSAEPVPGRSNRALLFLAALYHDIAKPRTRTVEPSGRVRFLGHPEEGAETAARRARALALSADEVQALGSMVRHHMRVHFLSNRFQEVGQPPVRRSIYRFFRDTAAAGVAICLLSLADYRATVETSITQEAWLAELETCRALLEAYFEPDQDIVSPPRLVDGSDLMRELQIRPGPQLGGLLAAIRESQAAGEVHTREDALAFARQWLSRPEAAGGREEE